MLDLCSGTGSASDEMQRRGWTVITLDYDSKFNPSIVADVRDYHYTGPRPDLIWCSPPCDEFAREFMPWCKTGKAPDMSIYRACRRIIRDANPRYWVIENVRGAVKYFGKARVNYGPFFLWGVFPDLGRLDLVYRKKESYSSDQAEKRAMIPRMITVALANAVEQQTTLFEYAESIS